MSNVKQKHVNLRVWPHVYVVARLAGLPAVLPPALPNGAPFTFVVSSEGVSFLGPESMLADLKVAVLDISKPWSALTLGAVFPLDTVGVLAAASRALADIEAPVMVFSSVETDHFLVPEKLAGRAVAALRQARLERCLPD